MNDRIKMIRNILGLTQGEFAERLKRSRSNIASIELGNYRITERFIDAVCSTFNVNHEWLLNGDGEMFQAKHIDETLALECAEIIAGDNVLKKYILSSFLKMDDSVWLELEKDIMKKLETKQKEKNKKEADL